MEGTTLVACIVLSEGTGSSKEGREGNKVGGAERKHCGVEEGVKESQQNDVS